MNLRDTRIWMKKCPHWCDENHLDGSIFAGAHMSVESVRSAPSPRPDINPHVDWTKETLLIAGTTYMVCMSSDSGRVLLVIESGESVEDFEQRVKVATPRIMEVLGQQLLIEHDWEDMDLYVRGY